MWWPLLPPRCSATHTSDSLAKSWDFSRVTPKQHRVLPRRDGKRRLRDSRRHLFASRVFWDQSDCGRWNTHADRGYLWVNTAYTEWNSKINTHHIVGWYHSHPSFGCWLSGIDVNTQELFQNGCDPFVAIVVDPIKSVNLRIPSLTQRR